MANAHISTPAQESVFYPFVSQIKVFYHNVQRAQTQTDRHIEVRFTMNKQYKLIYSSHAIPTSCHGTEVGPVSSFNFQCWFSETLMKFTDVQLKAFDKRP